MKVSNISIFVRIRLWEAKKNPCFSVLSDFQSKNQFLMMVDDFALSMSTLYRFDHEFGTKSVTSFSEAHQPGHDVIIIKNNYQIRDQF